VPGIAAIHHPLGHVDPGTGDVLPLPVVPQQRDLEFSPIVLLSSVLQILKHRRNATSNLEWPTMSMKRTCPICKRVCSSVGMSAL
jgi:hypothetical protein